jgi:hypothetical protein
MIWGDTVVRITPTSTFVWLEKISFDDNFPAGTIIKYGGDCDDFILGITTKWKKEV